LYCLNTGGRHSRHRNAAGCALNKFKFLGGPYRGKKRDLKGVTPAFNAC
jgi:hypothetical protein